MIVLCTPLPSKRSRHNDAQVLLSVTATPRISFVLSTVTCAFTATPTDMMQLCYASTTPQLYMNTAPLITSKYIATA